MTSAPFLPVLTWPGVHFFLIGGLLPLVPLCFICGNSNQVCIVLLSVNLQVFRSSAAYSDQTSSQSTRQTISIHVTLSSKRLVSSNTHSTWGFGHQKRLPKGGCLLCPSRTATASTGTVTRHPCAGDHPSGQSSLVSLGSHCRPWNHRSHIRVKWANLVWLGRMDSILFLELLTLFNCTGNLTGASAPKGLNECTLAAYSFMSTMDIYFAWQLMYCSGWYRISFSVSFSPFSQVSSFCSSTARCCHSEFFLHPVMAPQCVLAFPLPGQWVTSALNQTLQAVACVVQLTTPLCHSTPSSVARLFPVGVLALLLASLAPRDGTLFVGIIAWANQPWLGLSFCVVWSGWLSCCCVCWCILSLLQSNSCVTIGSGVDDTIPGWIMATLATLSLGNITHAGRFSVISTLPAYQGWTLVVWLISICCRGFKYFWPKSACRVAGQMDKSLSVHFPMSTLWMYQVALVYFCWSHQHAVQPKCLPTNRSHPLAGIQSANWISSTGSMAPWLPKGQPLGVDKGIFEVTMGLHLMTSLNLLSIKMDHRGHEAFGLKNQYLNTSGGKIMVSIPPILPTLSPGHQTRPPASDIEWPSLEICSNLFIWSHCKGLPGPADASGGCWRSYGQHKRVVRILLECLLVFCSVFRQLFYQYELILEPQFHLEL